jgi:hypothetical protein
MSTPFSETLVKLRAEAGFASAYQFFHDNGGPAVLGLTYRRYVLIEQGRNLPLMDKLKKLFYALRLVPQSPNANALMVAWLRTMAGEDNYNDLLRPVIAPAAESKGVSPLHKAVEKSLANDKYYVKPEQFLAVLSSFEAYLCFHAMLSETGAWKIEDLAKALQAELPKVKEAMRQLAAAKLMKEVRKGVYKCPMAGATIETPQMNLLGKAAIEKMKAYNRQLITSGRNEWYSTCMLRADGPAFKGYLPVLNMAVHTAGAYEIKRKTPGSALFLIEGRITRLRDF